MNLFWLFLTIVISVANATETPELFVQHYDFTEEGLVISTTSLNLTEATPYIKHSDDNYSSDTFTKIVQAVKGRWVLYPMANYEGNPTVLEEGQTTKIITLSARPSTLELIIFEDKESGRSVPIYGATSDFSYGFDWLNDAASSVQAVKGTWELYEDADYQGNRMIVREGGRQSVEYDDEYSSARPVCSYQNDPATAKIRVFNNRSQQGDFKNYFVDTAQLGDYDDKISSVRVFSGIWELYEKENFEGKRRVVEAPDEIDVEDDFYSSLRPVCATYSPTPAQCTVTNITIHNNGNEYMAKKDNKGTQIVGILLDSSCQGGATGHLIMDRTDSVEESFGIEIGEDNEINWGASVSVTTSASFGIAEIAEVGVDVSVGASVGGSRTMSKSHSKETTSGYSQSVGYELEYNTPAVAVLFGSVDKYIVDDADVPVTLHMDCPDGPTDKNSSIALTATTYESADYWYLIKDLDQATCDAHYKEIYTCMQKFKETYSKKFEARENVKGEFEACFKF